MEQWQELIRHVLAVEMETAGAYRAAQGRESQYPVIPIRGISDIVGLERDDRWTAYACHTAAAFALAFARSWEEPPRATQSAGPQAVPNIPVSKNIDLARTTLELLPKLRDSSVDPGTRALALVKLRDAAMMDYETAVEVIIELHRDGIDQVRFNRAVAAVLPGGLPAIARRADRLSEVWRERWKATGSSYDLKFSPMDIWGHPDKETFPETMKDVIFEGRAWHRALMANLPRLETTPNPLDDPKILYESFLGLLRLMSSGASSAVLDLSKSSCSWIALIGGMERLLFSGDDMGALRIVEPIIFPGEASYMALRFARAVLGWFRDSASLLSGGIAATIARILVSGFPEATNIEARHEAFWLQWDAAETLARAAATHPSRHQSQWRRISRVSFSYCQGVGRRGRSFRGGSDR